MNIYYKLRGKYTQVHWKVKGNVAYSCFRFRTNIFCINKDIENFIIDFLIETEYNNLIN